MASFANTPVYLDSLPQGSNPSIISKISTPFAFPIVKIDMYNRNIFFVYLNNKDCYRLQSSNKYLYVSGSFENNIDYDDYIVKLYSHKNPILHSAIKKIQPCFSFRRYYETDLDFREFRHCFILLENKELYGNSSLIRGFDTDEPSIKFIKTQEDYYSDVDIQKHILTDIEEIYYTTFPFYTDSYSPILNDIEVPSTDTNGGVNIPMYNANGNYYWDRWFYSINFCMFFKKTDGTVYACGDNTFGQLGIPLPNDGDILPFADTPISYDVTYSPLLPIGVIQPTLVPLPGPVKTISTNKGNTIFILQDNTAYGIGWNANGCLGLGHDNLQTTLAQITYPFNSNIKKVQISCKDILLEPYDPYDDPYGGVR